MGKWSLVCTLALSLAASGCHKAADVASAPPAAATITASPAAGAGHSTRPAGVDWFEGDVAQAFMAAEQQHKPVFVYFGAVWCPPCQQLKATVFKRRDFLEKLSLFVPVYLDGDAPDAQRWAAEFKIVGYPTALILAADHAELERVSGGMDLGRYAEVLDLGLSATRPISAILSPTDSGNSSVSLEDCRRLAYNGWPLEEEWIYSNEYPGWLTKTSADLTQAASRCPADAATERARLRIMAMSAELDSESDALKSGQKPSAKLTAAIEQVRPILADQTLALKLADALECLDGNFFKLSVAQDPSQAAAVESRWFRLMDAVGADTRYSAADQLYSVNCKIVAAKALEPSGKVPAALADEAHQRVDAALALNTDAYTRTSLVNAALNVLDSLEDSDRSYAVLSAEIMTSKTPYYYMSDLAEIEEARGHKDAAVAWLARAYNESQGEATRFQWGVAYVRGLIRLRPGDDAAIAAAAHQVLGEVDGEGRLYGRSKNRLITLAKTLHEWNDKSQHAGAVQAVRTQVQGICAKIPAGDPALTTCASFSETV